MLDYYTFLGVPPNASDAVILEAYLAKVQEGNPATVAQADTALGILTDPPQRAAFDQARRARMTAPAAGKAGGARPPSAPPRPARPIRPPTPASATKQRPPRAMPPPRSAPASATPAPSRRPWLPVVVGIALLGGIVFAALLLTRGTSGPGAGGVSAPPATGLAAQAVEAALVNGVQTQDVLLNGDTFQYEPKVIKVKQGIPVRFNLSVKGEPG